MTDYGADKASISSAPTGAQVYLDFANRLVDDQDARKESIERRGLAVVTTAGALVTLMFALVAAISQAKTFQLPTTAHGPLGFALGAFVLAAAGAIFTNMPLSYKNVGPEELGAFFLDHVDGPEVDEKVRISATQLGRFKASSRVNGFKAWVLVFAMVCELFAISGVAIAGYEILSHR
jgi:hypothetical protein